jgi:hypothetical protein
VTSDRSKTDIVQRAEEAIVSLMTHAQGGDLAALVRARQALYAPCPACGQLKDGTGLLCAYCHRAARIQLEEDNRL